MKSDTELEDAIDAIRSNMACMDLLIEMGAQRDSGVARDNIDLFTNDGEMICFEGPAGSDNIFMKALGSAELAEMFVEREQDVGHQTKHIVSNAKFTAISRDEIEATSTWTVHLLAQEPRSEAMIPALIADCRDRLVRGVDGRWRFRRRQVNVIVRRTP